MMITELIDEFSLLLENILYSDTDKLINCIDYSVTNNKNIFICGNGGSSANANILARILNRCFTGKTTGRSTSLNQDVALLTELAVDYGYHDVFGQQLKTEAKADDLLIVISGSGNSPNIIRAVEYSAQNDIRTFGLTGMGGGMLKKISPNLLVVPSYDMEQIENAHTAIIHALENHYRLQYPAPDRTEASCDV